MLLARHGHQLLTMLPSRLDASAALHPGLPDRLTPSRNKGGSEEVTTKTISLPIAG